MSSERHTGRLTSITAQAAADQSWAVTDDRARRTAAARSAFLERFERDVDPEGRLTASERSRRANSARRAYFLRLAAKSAEARRRRVPDSSRDSAS